MIVAFHSPTNKLPHSFVLGLFNKKTDDFTERGTMATVKVPLFEWPEIKSWYDNEYKVEDENEEEIEIECMPNNNQSILRDVWYTFTYYCFCKQWNHHTIIKYYLGDAFDAYVSWISEILAVKKDESVFVQSLVNLNLFKHAS